MVEIIPVSTTLELQAADESHVPALHQLVLKNKAWLQQSLDWPQYVTSQEETRKHVQGNILLHQRGYAKMYLIFCQNEMAGVLSFNAIEPINKAAYIGYWLDESLQGQGIMSQSLQALMTHYAGAAIFGASSLNAALIIRPVMRSHGATILRWKAV